MGWRVVLVGFMMRSMVDIVLLSCLLLFEWLDVLLFMCCYFCLFSGFGVGWVFDVMDVGFIFFIIVVFIQQWDLFKSEVGWIVFVGFIGMVIGVMFGGLFVDCFG